MPQVENPLGLQGIEFTEFASPSPEFMHRVFTDFGFSKLRRHPDKPIDYYRQNDIHFLLNRDRSGFGGKFSNRHGPSICSMGWRVEHAQQALQAAVERGAVAVPASVADLPYPAIYGIGESLIYLIEPRTGGTIYEADFEPLSEPHIVADKGFIAIDHLTNNVVKGSMQQWADFYKNVFGFTEVRYFDIRGQTTGLLSYALRSPDGSFCIPINEGKGDERNQIDEYLRDYQGPGVQHLAFLTNDIVASLDAIDSQVIETLDIHDDYYDQVFQRVPNVKEDHQRIRAHQILVDGDEQSYLLQIFTKNLFGPIFIEIIQRENNQGFGEGNFQALFESIERDQQRRGVL